ncbi:endonuclease domain-containing protein [Agromyces neolithicus]|uniref:Type IV toxin-antitoxin system AbiEi family antitoxin domain-containing protein n=1 Tax=Agromyces neolithicus TaxID=269420 RepID=A0ABN2M5D6_9MICO
MSWTPSHVARHIRENGGARSVRQLRAADIDRAAVVAAFSDHAIMRVRRGWYAVRDAPDDVVRAVRVGGALTGASVARLHGLWLHTDRLLHVRVPRTASRLRPPTAALAAAAAAAATSPRLDPSGHGVCVHYRSAPPLDSARDSLPIALAEMLSCATAEHAITTIDSALASGQLTDGGLEQVREFALPSRRTLVDRASAQSESGIESRVRLFLRTHRITHRAQVEIEGVGRVDLVVGNRLVIEIDGSKFHTGTEFERDRRRDFELAMRGFLVLRLSYRMIMDEWDASAAGILALVARGEHRWGYRARSTSATSVPMPKYVHEDPLDVPLDVLLRRNAG